jgi:acyl carrier protein
VNSNSGLEFPPFPRWFQKRDRRQDECDRVSQTRTLVIDAIARIQRERGLAAASLSDDDVLGEGGLGLDSLDMATIVAQLDTALHKDPFAAGVPRFRTVGEFVRLYESDSGQ